MTFLAANISAGFHQINFLKIQKCSARSPLSNDVHKKRIWWIHERPVGAKESATFGLGGRALRNVRNSRKFFFFRKKWGKHLNEWQPISDKYWRASWRCKFDTWPRSTTWNGSGSWRASWWRACRSPAHSKVTRSHPLLLIPKKC